MSKTLKEILDTDLSPENVKEMSLGQLNNFLIDNDIVESQNDIKMLIVESIQKALAEDDEFPIRYYAAEETMPEESKVVQNPGEMLTDDLVQSMRGLNK